MAGKDCLLFGAFNGGSKMDVICFFKFLAGLWDGELVEGMMREGMS